MNNEQRVAQSIEQLTKAISQFEVKTTSVWVHSADVAALLEAFEASNKTLGIVTAQKDHLRGARDLCELRANELQTLVDAFNKAADNPALDGTDGAHPAWWRGEEYGASGVCAQINEVLDTGEVKGCGQKPIQEVRTRVAVLMRERDQLKQNAEDVERVRRLLKEAAGHRDEAIRERDRYKQLAESAQRLLSETEIERAKAADARDAARAENAKLEGVVHALSAEIARRTDLRDADLEAIKECKAKVTALIDQNSKLQNFLTSYELDVDRVLKGDKCAMELAVDEATALRAEVKRLTELNEMLRKDVMDTAAVLVKAANERDDALRKLAVLENNPIGAKAGEVLSEGDGKVSSTDWRDLSAVRSWARSNDYPVIELADGGIEVVVREKRNRLVKYWVVK